MKLKSAALLLGLGGFLISGAATATLVDATDVNLTTGIGGDFLFTASGGSLGTKIVNDVEALGVTTGPSGNEIDIDGDESITVSRNDGGSFQLASTTLAFFYDGTEFGDYQERAVIEAFFGNERVGNAVIENVYTGESEMDFRISLDGGSNFLSIFDSSSYILSGTTESTGSTAGLVQLGALFGSQMMDSLKFTAATGTCGTLPVECTNQSDYSIKDIRTVPEPGTLALLGLGLTGLVVARRKTK